MLQYFGDPEDAAVLLKPDQVCRILHMTRIELYEVTERGDLPFETVGHAKRYRVDQVEHYQNTHMDEQLARMNENRRAAIEDAE